jgi:uncharacterized membrane protein YphA (DoxX/SURF4 family)
MNSVRTAARAMLAGVFVAGGVHGLANAEHLVPAAKRVTDRIAPTLRRIHPSLPTDAHTMVQLDHATKLVGGLLLVTALRRPAAIVLAGSLIPTTLAGHRFWESEDPADRSAQQTHFLKNLGLIGGLLLVAVDTEGRPGLRWRMGAAGRRLHHSQRRTARTISHANTSLHHRARDARTRVRLAAHTNPIGRRLGA